MFGDLRAVCEVYPPIRGQLCEQVGDPLEGILETPGSVFSQIVHIWGLAQRVGAY